MTLGDTFLEGKTFLTTSSFNGKINNVETRVFNIPAKPKCTTTVSLDKFPTFLKSLADSKASAIHRKLTPRSLRSNGSFGVHRSYYGKLSRRNYYIWSEKTSSNESNRRHGCLTWSSPGNNRLCVNLLFEPTMDELAPTLAGAKLFSKRSTWNTPFQVDLFEKAYVCRQSSPGRKTAISVFVWMWKR